MPTQQVISRIAYKFDIKDRQQVNRMGLLDAENLKFAAPVQPKPSLPRNRAPETLQKLDNRVTPQWHFATQMQLP